MENRPRDDPVRGAVAAWLIMMTRPRALDLLRPRRRSFGDSCDDVAAIPDPGPGVEFIAANEAQVALTRDAVQQGRRRRVIVSRRNLRTTCVPVAT
jgi:hypothetical protein